MHPDMTPRPEDYCDRYVWVEQEYVDATTLDGGINRVPGMLRFEHAEEIPMVDVERLNDWAEELMAAGMKANEAADQLNKMYAMMLKTGQAYSVVEWLNKDDEEPDEPSEPITLDLTKRRRDA